MEGRRKGEKKEARRKSIIEACIGGGVNKQGLNENNGES